MQEDSDVISMKVLNIKDLIAFFYPEEHVNNCSMESGFMLPSRDQVFPPLAYSRVRFYCKKKKNMASFWKCLGLNCPSFFRMQPRVGASDDMKMGLIPNLQTEGT